MTSTPSTQSERPYRPASGTEGAAFMAVFCDQCKADAAYRADAGDSCPIIANAEVYDVGEPEYPPQWVQDERGPRCTAFDPEETPSSTPGTGGTVVVPPAGGE